MARQANPSTDLCLLTLNCTYSFYPSHQLSSRSLVKPTLTSSRNTNEG
ncbi:MAG: hypothetical protein JST43_12080 [Bacteroidetes bacterium]|nr:hypothetical protein [Bacteroidota bacterium]MBS1541382.1 hypothetical protein [Bacteroidota bacterium]